jgi:signal transduction histidine kinase
MTKELKTQSLHRQLHQVNERLLLSAFDARDSEERANAALSLLEAVLRQMPSGVIVADPVSGQITLSNETAQRLWPACSSVADISRHFHEHCRNSDGGRCMADELPLARAIATGENSKRKEIRFARSDGSYGTMNVECMLVRKPQGEAIAAVLICEDITDQKALLAREETGLLQLRELSGKIESIREEERTRIAREIHDELGQTMTALNFDLAWMLKHVHSKTLREKIRLMMEEAARTVHTVQRLAAELRPSVLDELGLIPAIEWQLSEFRRHTGIRTTFTSAGDRKIDQDQSTAVFRIVQEGLTNVMRHAKATRVNVTLKTDHSSLAMRLSDNGRGITINEINSHGSLGILGMKERVLRFGGTFVIGPGSRAGTHLDVLMPLRPSTAGKNRGHK